MIDEEIHPLIGLANLIEHKQNNGTLTPLELFNAKVYACICRDPGSLKRVIEQENTRYVAVNYYTGEVMKDTEDIDSVECKNKLRNTFRSCAEYHTFGTIDDEEVNVYYYSRGNGSYYIKKINKQL